MFDWFRRKRAREQDIDEELNYHLAMLAQEHLEAGVAAKQADFSARKSLGNRTLIQESLHEVWSWHFMETIWQDFRYALRQLRQNPGFAFIAVVTVALGIGANTAIFSLLNGVLLRPLPGVPAPSSLVLFSDGNFEGVFGAHVPDPGPLPAYSYLLYERLRDQRQLFDGIAAQQSNYLIAKVESSSFESNEAADQAAGRCVSANYFDVLGVSAFRGRTFRAEDQTAPGANPVIVLSYSYWENRFGGNSAVVGRQLIVNEAPYTVIGITPPDFRRTTVGETTDFWVPLTMQATLMRRPDVLSRRDMWWLLVVGRLKPDVSQAQAQAGCNIILQQYLAGAVASHDELAGRKLVRVELLPGARGASPLRKKFGIALTALMGGVGLLLLIACVNVSQLLLARSVRRRREISLRLTLGASRMRVLQQLLTEGLLLSFLGGIAGVIVGTWCTHALLRLASPGPAALSIDVTPDLRVFAFTSLLTIATGVLFSLIPLWSAARIELSAALQAASRSVSGGFGHKSFSRLLLMSEVALSLLLITGAALLVQTLRNLKNFDKGFREEHVLLVDFSARLTGLTPTQLLPVYQQLLDRISVLPGVRSASLGLQTPLSGSTNTTDVSIPGHIAKFGEDLETEVMVVTPRYFETMGMSLAQGRYFGRDDQANAPKAAIVNEAFARRFLGEEALDRRFGVSRDTADLTVVGVVRDAKLDDLRSPVQPVMYLPLAQSPDFVKSIQVRTAADPAILAKQIRQIVHEANSDFFVLNVTTLQHQVDRSLVQEKLIAILSSSFGGVALLLVCIGLYGVLSQGVVQRTAEIGIRMALGARRQQVRWLILREALLLVVIGLAVGVPIAVAAARALTSMLFGLNAVNPLILSCCCIAIVLVTAMASFVPAWRASRLDPMNALRYE